MDTSRFELTERERKQAWLEAEQSMGFLRNCIVEDLTFQYDDISDNHAQFIAKAQISKVQSFYEPVELEALEHIKDAKGTLEKETR